MNGTELHQKAMFQEEEIGYKVEGIIQMRFLKYRISL